MEYTISSIDDVWVPNTITVGNIEFTYWNIDYDGEDKEREMKQRRIVAIYVIDPDKNVDTRSALIYKSDCFVTDLSDRELLFEIGLKNILDSHNRLRGNTVDEEGNSLKKIGIDDLDIFIYTIHTCK